MPIKDFATSYKIVKQIFPLDINAAVQGGNYNFVSLRNYQQMGFRLNVGAHSGDGVAFSMRQAKNVEGNGSKAMTNHTYGFRNTPGGSPQEESDRWDKFTITSGLFDIAASTLYWIPFRPAMLDVSNDFDCIRGEMEAGSAATLVSLDLFLWGGPEGIDTSITHIPSVAVNVMPNS